MNSIRKHLTSYRYSLRGIWIAMSRDYNVRIHVTAMVVVITLNALLRVTRTEWIVSLMLVGLMLMAEIFNTAIEKLADRVTKEYDQLIADIKDLASGAVTLLGFFAVVCGLIIYLPYFMSL